MPQDVSGCRRRRAGRTFRANAKQPSIGKPDRRGDGRDRGGESRPERRPAKDYNGPALDKVMLGELVGFVSGVPLCLTSTVSKICWRFYTGTLRRRLTRSHSIVGALSMAICQWDSKSTVWATGVSSLLWWKVLEERKKFST